MPAEPLARVPPPMPAADEALPTVVLGGMLWSPATSYPSVQNAEELARTRPTLYIYPEGRGRMGERLPRLLRDTAAGDVRGLKATRMTIRQEDDALWVAPIGGLWSLLPLASYDAVRRHHVRRCVATIRRWLRSIGAERCAILTYWWFAADVFAALPEAVVRVYDCVDEHTAYPGSRLDAGTVVEHENRLLDLVDRTYIVSPRLLEAREGPGREIHVLPNAFDLRGFDRLREAGFQIPDALAAVTGPVIGHLGNVGGRIDWDLLDELTRRRPDWTFAFISADAGKGPAHIVGRPNVLLLGMIPYHRALGAISAFDVATIPFARTEFTLGNSFAKLLDYLAHGTPVVATPLPDTEGMAAEGTDIVHIAADADGWIAAIERSLAEPADDPARAARRAVVERRSIAGRLATMLDDDSIGAATG